MNRGFKSCLLVTLLTTSACSTVEAAFQNRRGAYTQNTADLQRNDVTSFVANQNSVMNRFVLLSGVEYNRRPLNMPADLPESMPPPGSPPPPPPPPLGPPPPDVGFALVPKDNEWRPVVDAGMNYVDVRCDRFIDALFWFNRIRETASREIRFAGAASAAALTILSASQELIGLAPLGFGFADQTVNNIGQGLLYDLPPAVIRTLVREEQAAYRKAMEGKTYGTRALAMTTIQGYASLCLPASIESEVSRAISDRHFQPLNYNPPPPPGKPGTPPPPPPPPPPPSAATGPPQIEAVPPSRPN